MNAKKFFGAVCAAVVVLIAGLFFSIDYFVEPPTPREPASVPDGYESLKACDKQDVLWQKIQTSLHRELPPLRSFGAFQLLAMAKQHVSTKGSHVSDFAPPGWTKYLHNRGMIAKVKIVPASQKYTGLFQGADCALLRLSLTFQPGGSRAVAPGLALKILRDGVPSANVSALVALDGQGGDYNFFKYPMSNIVPISGSFGAGLVHKVFATASKWPEELLASDFAAVDVRGAKVASVVSPRQLFFVPGEGLALPSEEHELRDDFIKIPNGTTIYHVRAVPEKFAGFNYADYKPETVAEFLKQSEPVADIVMTSEFRASAFGDEGIFFRHQLRD